MKRVNVLITGGTGGLGPAVVKAFIATGAVVYVPAKGRVPKGADALPYIDVTDEAAVTKLFAQLPRLWASVHVVGGFAMQPILDTTLADIRAQHAINFSSAFLCTREAVRNMGSRPGRIVNVASRAAEMPGASLTAYASSKAAVIAMTRSVAAEVRGQGILVNAVSPTTIDTPANRKAMPLVDRASWVKPSQIAATIAWLCSVENDIVSGAVVPVG